MSRESYPEGLDLVFTLARGRHRASFRAPNLIAPIDRVVGRITCLMSLDTNHHPIVEACHIIIMERRQLQWYYCRESRKD